MELGKYNKKPISFFDYEIKSFAPHIFLSPYSNLAGCGATALSVLTGVEPFNIKNYAKNGENWADAFMISYLRRKKWAVKQLTRLNAADGDYITDKINRFHIVLLSQAYIRGQQSWSVLFNKEWIIHNFELVKIDCLEFLNRPISSAYLVKPF